MTHITTNYLFSKTNSKQHLVVEFKYVQISVLTHVFFHLASKITLIDFFQNVYCDT